MCQTTKKKLQVVQNKLIRFMLNLGPSDHVGIEQLNTLGLLNVVDRVRLHNAQKVFYKQSPVYLMANFNKCREWTHNTRHKILTYPESREKRQAHFTIMLLKTGKAFRTDWRFPAVCCPSSQKQYMQKLQLMHQRNNLYFISFIAFKYDNNDNKNGNNDYSSHNNFNIHPIVP